MSAADTTAAAAGAAAAAAAAAPQSPDQSNATVQPLNNANVGGDSLVCQWTACGERLPTPEQLYVS
jgi:hypothetical protein